MELTFDHLTKDYGGVIALNGVSLTLNEGVYGLLGPNGAGKSTMMNILSGNLSQSAGRLAYNGTDIRQLGREFKARLGYMPQQQALYPGFTAVQFLSYMAALRGMSRPEAKDAVPRVLEQVELAEVAGRRIRTFSGGMKQRLLIAQAILADPDVLILDEPTAGLDPKQRIAIRNLIAAIARRKIVIISTHVVSDVAYISREILLLDRGRLLQKAPPSELIRQLEGCVWELTADAEGWKGYQARYPVSYIAYDGDGFCLRLLSGEEIPGGHTVTPTLEDVYLRHFGE